MKTAEQNLSKVLTGDYDNENWYPSDLTTEKIFEAMNIHADQYKSKWISVKERLPDIQGCYLIFTILDIVSISNYIFHDGKWDWSGRYDKNNITHWMKLPEKPQ